MKLIVGLGNPGREYRQTRHNVGFMAVERLATRHGFSQPKAKFQAAVLEGSIAGQKVMLMQPTTYMNKSGQAVAEAAGFHKLDAADVMVVVDDMAMPLGTLRIRPRGGHGGHNGLTDIQRALGTDAYPRLRIGIGAAQIDGRSIEWTDHVLGRFTDDQLALLNPAIDKACDALECWAGEDINKAMNRYNLVDNHNEE